MYAPKMELHTDLFLYAALSSDPGLTVYLISTSLVAIPFDVDLIIRSMSSF